jgi:hypothetical protein
MLRWKWIGWSVMIVVLILAPFAIADYCLYWSHRDEIVRELQTMPAEDRRPPAAVTALIEGYYGPDRLDSLLAQRFEYELQGSGVRLASNLSRAVREILFTEALKLHLSREERLSLFCHRMQFDGGEGLSAGALRYYGKKPGELSELDTAGLIAADMRPRYSSPFTHPDRFETERRRVLERTGAR